MPAHIKQHGKTGYWYLVDGYLTKSLKTKSKGEAQARLKQYGRGKFGLNPVPTVGEYYKRWIETKVAPLVRRSAEMGYKYNFGAHILPKFKHMSLSDIAYPDIVEFRKDLLHQRSMKTVKNILSIFHSLYADAQREYVELQGKQPFALKWQRQIKERPDPFSAPERDRILEWWRTNDFFYYPWVYLLFHTGMRPSEAAGLQWADVNFAGRTISITKSRVLHEDQPTKTTKSVRRIEVNEDVMRLLEILPSRQLGLKYVFVNKFGKPMHAKKWAEHNWAEPLVELAIRHRKAYAMRHTFITEMVMAGKSERAIADYVGTSTAMIESNYCGVISMSPVAAVLDPTQAKIEKLDENPNEINDRGLGFDQGHLGEGNRIGIRPTCDPDHARAASGST
jgi:integrase